MSNSATRAVASAVAFASRQPTSGQRQRTAARVNLLRVHLILNDRQRPWSLAQGERLAFSGRLSCNIYILIRFPLLTVRPSSCSA